MSWKVEMEDTNWLKQTKGKPLFPKLLWSRPENKRNAGKLLIIGGNSNSFSEPSLAYTNALAAGIGIAKIILPDVLKKVLKVAQPEADFAPSTPSGSFSRQALELFLDYAKWADAVLLAGGFGHNSETAILLESFISKYPGLIIICGDSLEYFYGQSAMLLQRKETVIVGNGSQIQKLAAPAALIKQNTNLAQFISQLSDWGMTIEPEIVTWHDHHIVVAVKEKVSTTLIKDIVETEVAAQTSVWRLQQPEKPFDALTTAVYASSS